jgi:hypothetical protein
LVEFAHVEFTAVLATILTKYTVEAAAIKEGASHVAMRRDIMALVEGSTASMAVNFREPEGLWIRLVAR